MTTPYDTDNKDETVEGITLKAATIKATWTPDDLDFFFTNLETDMEFVGVKSQYLKRQCLKKNLPESVVLEFKGLLRLNKANAGQTPYKTLKDALLLQYGQKKEDAFEFASGLTLTSSPSALCKRIADTMCTQQPPLQSCCCETAISGMWRRQLPDGVKEAIAGMPMTGQGAMEAVMKRADDVYFSTRNKLATTAATVSEVAAFRGKGNGHGRGRGGNPGSGGQNPGQSTTHATNAAKTSQKPKWGQKHPDDPPEGVCKQHYQHGKSAHFCRRLHDCPWRDFVSPPSGK